MLRRVTLVRTDVSVEHVSSIINVRGIGELGTTLTVTSSRSSLRTVPPKRRFLQEPHSVSSQKTAFFIVTAVKTSNLTCNYGNYAKNLAGSLFGRNIKTWRKRTKITMERR
jgi:hypothetical protein